MNKTFTPSKSVTPTKEQKETDFPFSPSELLIKNILNYSKALEVKSSKELRHIEVVLN